MSLMEFVIDNFSDEENGGFFYTAKFQDDVIIRKKEWYDGAVPSGNGMMAANLIYFSEIFNNPNWRERAINLTANLTDLTVKYPTSFGNWASLILNIYHGFNEIAIVGDDFEKLRDELLAHFIPNKVLQCSAEASGSKYPLLAGKPASKQPFAYLCRNYTCKKPVKSVTAIIEEITAVLK